MNNSASIFKPLIFVSAIFLIAMTFPQHDISSTSESAIPDDSLLQDVTGSELQDVVNSYQGKKTVLVNVWATWCAPCVEEFPHLVELQETYEDELQVIFVSADFPDSRDRALSFLKEQNVDWPTYFKTGKDQPFIEALSGEWSGALPFTKIINKEGKVVASWEQGADYEKFETNIKKAVTN